MFLNSVVFPLDRPFYEPTEDCIIFDNELFWIYIGYYNKLFKL